MPALSAPPFHVLTKPSGARCNLDCTYCFYVEKDRLRRLPGPSRMSDAVLEAYVRQYIASQDTPEVAFAWQGGEPTLMGIPFFERVLHWQRIHHGGKTIRNGLQTNGTLLNDAWGSFLSRHGFLVGISIDGPPALHDAYRVDRRRRPTSSAVLRGVEILHRHRVEFNTLTVVHRRNARHPAEIYQFLKKIGSRFLQFIPVVERWSRLPAEEAGPASRRNLDSPPATGADPSDAVTDWSVQPEDYGLFLNTVFDEWVHGDVGRVFVRDFDSTLAAWAGHPSPICIAAETCGNALAVEHNGDVYPCDHYVYPEWKLGNLLATDLRDLAHSPAQRRFGADKRDTLPAACRQCHYLFACHGDCPKLRFVPLPGPGTRISYLCPGRLAFFRHVDPYMQIMAGLLHRQRAPAEIMSLLRACAPAATPGRNATCPCGSGHRYKRCCGAKDRARLRPPPPR